MTLCPMTLPVLSLYLSLWRGKVPGHCIPKEERGLTFLGSCSMKSCERGSLRGLNLLTGYNGEQGRKFLSQFNI